MHVLNKFFTYKRLYLSYYFHVTLIGCSNSNTPSGPPKQTKQIKQIKQENTGHDSFAKLEKEYNAKLGIYALDTGTNQTIAYHSNDRFAFASTSKSLAAGALYVRTQ